MGLLVRGGPAELSGGEGEVALSTSDGDKRHRSPLAHSR
jgi:hypothetical protein